MSRVDFGAGECYVYGVNDSGTAVGWGWNKEGRWAFTWNRATGSRSIGAPQGSNASEGYAINNKGQVVGRSFFLGIDRPTLYDPVVGWKNLGALDPRYGAFADDINNAGQVVGVSHVGGSGQLAVAHTFIWTEKAGMVDIGLPQNRHGIQGRAISDTGVIVGLIGLFSGARHSFYRTPDGTITELEPLPGAVDHYALDVNSHLQIVGRVGVFGGADPSAGYVWDPIRGMSDLNLSMDGSGEGYWIFAANGINDSGQITGGAIKKGQFRAVLLTPLVPESPRTVDFATVANLFAR